MKDAYSFDLNEKAAIDSYEKMRVAYRKIFTRAGLKFKAVDADTGAIGGSKSEEFTVLASAGEDEIISCSNCDYGANQEKAVGIVDLPKETSGDSLSVFPTPGLKTIDDLANSLSTTSSSLLKTMIATDSEGRCLVVCLRGDHELHEIKLQAAFKDLKGVRLATDAELAAWKLPKGSLGPVQFPSVGKEVLIIADTAVSLDAPYVCGANSEGQHFKNLVLKRDTPKIRQSILRRVVAGERCIKCDSPLEVHRGIEVGHVFYLGQKYSEAMKLKVLGEDGKDLTLEMGCYGIGVGRTVAASIEQNHDKDGIIWPLSLAPYAVGIVSLGEGRPVLEAKKLYESFLNAGFDVIWDDRDLSPGVKLKDIDLIGVPYQIVVGEKGLKNEQVEFRLRGRTKEFIPLGEAYSGVSRRITEEFQNLAAAASLTKSA